MKPINPVTMMRKSISLFLAVCLVPTSPYPVQASESSGMFEEAQILTGDVLSVKTKNLARVSVTDPKIADISDAKPEEVMVIGKKQGQTVLFVWDDSGKRTVIIRVVDEDLSIIRARVRSLLESAGIFGVNVQENQYEGKVVLSGTLPEDKHNTLSKVIVPLEEKVINVVQKETLEDLIQIDMQVTELSTTLAKELGVDWFTGTQTLDAATGQYTTTHNNSFEPTMLELLPSQDGSAGDLFKIGKFFRGANSALVAKINALVQEGKARILSKPRLVVKNAHDANFVVGGEIPIRTTTTNATGGSVQENVDFKEYGLILTVTPSLVNGKVDIKLSVEISDIDSTKPTGDDIAFVTRSAKTQLMLEDRQTIVLAGLIKKRNSQQVNRIPFLSSIPVVGLLFRSKRTPVADEDTEVVISLTPTILPAQASVPVAAAKVDSTPVPVAVVPDVETASGKFPEIGRNSAEIPVISKNAASQSVSISPDLEPYAKSVQQKISSAIAYPYEAQEKGWQGTVKLGLIIRKDGSLRDVFIKESSGYDVFDRDALHTAQILAPYASFPSSVTEEQVSIALPIVYNLDSFLKNVVKPN